MCSAYLLLFLFVCYAFGSELTLSSPTENIQTARYDHGCVNLAGKIYILGGTPENSNATQSVEFLQSNGSWTYTSSMLVNRTASSFVTYQDRYIFALGGSTGFNSYSSSVEVFDNQYSNWTSLSPMSRKRTRHFSLIMNITSDVNNTKTNASESVTTTYLVAIGGDAESDQLYTYEYTVISYSNGTLLPLVWNAVPLSLEFHTAQYQATASLFNESILFIGGLTPGLALKSNVTSFPLSQLSSNITNANLTVFESESIPVPYDLGTSSVLTSNDMLYVIGGLTNGFNKDINSSTFVEIEDVVYSFDGTTWMAENISISSVVRSCSVANDEGIYVIGGYNTNGTILNSVQLLAMVEITHRGLSDGAVAGIIVGTLVGVAIFLGIIVYVARKGRKRHYREI